MTQQELLIKALIEIRNLLEEANIDEGLYNGAAVKALLLAEATIKKAENELILQAARKAASSWDLDAKRPSTITETHVCPVCDGKGFVNADGTPNNAFEGSDNDPVIPCPRCEPAARTAVSEE